MTTELTSVGFDATLADVRDVEGWMTDAQARRLQPVHSAAHRDSGLRLAPDPGDRLAAVITARSTMLPALRRPLGAAL